MMRPLLLLLSLFLFSNCHSRPAVVSDYEQAEVLTGAQQTALYFPLLDGKRLGIYTNQTGVVDSLHIVDLFHREGFDLRLIFAPEHGFRGTADAGEKVSDDIDPDTNIPIVSLYKNKGGKPTAAELAQIDLLIVDIQDVGLRFYTYYITLLKLMESCADADIPVLLLDRPNPNGFYVDGPILDRKHKSGVGYLPIPVVHGMTLGELARMMIGENWLTCTRECRLTVIPCANYTHDTKYQLPVAPSPNLPNMKSIYLYPSICLFEGTTLSLGRGTDFPFQVYGGKEQADYTFSFTPRSLPGAKNPPLKDQKLYGVDLRQLPDSTIWEEGLTLEYLIDAYQKNNLGEKFFTSFFEKLIGVDYVRQMILDGESAEIIKKRWQPDVEAFKRQRAPYLLYE